MSYCRFSSDNWRSDVYVYESEDGIEIHVAARKAKDDVVPAFRLGMQLEEYEEHMAAVERRVMVPIGGKFDGDSFVHADWLLAIERLREISAAGYHVPEYVFEQLESEIDDE